MIGTAVAPAVLSYLFHRIEARFDGRPTLLIIDEGWLALDDADFAGKLREWLKTLRKKNASVVFATQSLADIDGSAIAPAIIESCPTRILLPNDRAIEPQIMAIYRRFGLNDRQIEILARAIPEAGLLLPVAPRQSPVRTRPWRGCARFHRGFLQGRPGPDRRVLAEHGRDRLRAGLAQGPRTRLGLPISSRNLANGGILHEAPSPVRRRQPDRARADRRSPRPAAAQLIVFDPNNYAQNVLTAARALQQINNQITSLQNQAQMLINQAKNLASLPYSSLQQLEQSIQRTQQLLTQAQRIAYDIQQIDRAFSTTYAPASSSVPDQALIANAQSRWQNSVAGFQDAMRVQATVVGNLDTNRTQMSALVTQARARPGRCRRARPAISFSRLQAQQLADLTATVAAQGRAQSLESAQRTAAQDQGREQLRRFLTQSQGYQPTTVQMFH